ncbi:unnamed protein product, partial [Ixodes persulcatus]
MIDPGSSECIMGLTAAVKCKLQITCSLKGLYGFGSTDEYAVKSNGSAFTDISIDDIVCKGVEVLIVPDSVQAVGILVGRTWTEQHHIAYMRIGNKLRIGYRNDLPFCNIELPPPPSKNSLTVSETTTLPKKS